MNTNIEREQHVAIIIKYTHTWNQIHIKWYAFMGERSRGNKKKKKSKGKPKVQRIAFNSIGINDFWFLFLKVLSIVFDASWITFNDWFKSTGSTKRTISLVVRYFGYNSWLNFGPFVSFQNRLCHKKKKKKRNEWQMVVSFLSRLSFVLSMVSNQIGHDFFSIWSVCLVCFQYFYRLLPKWNVLLILMCCPLIFFFFSFLQAASRCFQQPLYEEWIVV